MELTPLVYVPGHGQYYDHGSKVEPGGHDRLMADFGRSGYAPTYHQLDWDSNDLDKWVSGAIGEVASVHEAHSRGVVVAGHSIGAVVAALTADHLLRGGDDVVIGYAGLSLSRYFGASDVEHLIENGVEFPDELFRQFAALSLPDIECPVQLYAGTQEISEIQDMHQRALRAWPQATSIQPDCDHNVFAPEYSAAIRANIGDLIPVSTPQ